MINTAKSVPDDHLLDEHFEQYGESVPSSVGRAVVQARRRLGLSQQEVADGTQLSRQQLSRMENGKIRKFDPLLMKELFEYLDLPSPETFQEDELSPKLKRIIEMLQKHGATMPASAIEFLDKSFLLALDHIDPTIYIEPTNNEGVYVPNNEWQWQMRPFATHLYNKLRREVRWDRLTVQRTLYVRHGSEVKEYPETYVQGDTSYLIYLTQALNNKYGDYAVTVGGVFDLNDLKEEIKNSIDKGDDLHQQIMMINLERNRRLTSGGEELRGTVKVVLYRKEPFTSDDWEIVRNEVQFFFAEIDQLNETLRN
tara:strand:+ start:1545 stop:2477 length:933 start_codon:yes stop_codon:yes gene_type:complete